MKRYHSTNISQPLTHRIQPLLALMLGAFVTGCTNMSGLDASSNYSCPAPPGVVCKPMSEVYRSPTRSGSVVPADSEMTTVHDAKSTNVGTKLAASAFPVTSLLPDDTFPLRSQPKVLRIWTAPYGDSDGDLHEEHRMYLQVDSGHWMMEHHQILIQNAFAPLRAPVSEKNAGSNDAAKLDKRPDVRSDIRSDALPGSQSTPPANSPDLFDSTPDIGVPK